MLNKNNYEVIGVDSNSRSIKFGLDQGYDVVNRDIFDYLASCKNEIFSSVSLFQVVEHLAVDDICRLVKEIQRVLVPGGISIIETVNPENVTVSSHTFYLDPTHIRPVPPMLLEFIHNYYGFKNSFYSGANKEALGRSLRRGLPILNKLTRINRIANLLNAKFYNSPDYAIIAIKEGKNVTNKYVEDVAKFARKCS